MNDRYQYGVRLGKPLGELIKAGEVLGPYTYYEASAVADHYARWDTDVIEWTSGVIDELAVVVGSEEDK